MYAGIIVATAWLTFQLPGGWGSVSAFYAAEPWKLSISGPPICCSRSRSARFVRWCSQSVSQQLMQPAMSAESEAPSGDRSGSPAPANGLWGAFVVSIGLAARAHPQFGALGPKVAATTMLVELLPWWLVAWILATFLGAILSSFAMAVMAPATIFAVDIYKNLFDPSADEARITNVTRIAILVLSVPAVLVAAYLPPVIEAINWLFAWLTPVFWLILFGLFWKRSNVAATVTLIVAWGLNSLWSFTSLASMLGMAGVPNVYVTLAVSLVVGGSLTAALDGKPGLLFARPELMLFWQIFAANLGVIVATVFVGQCPRVARRAEALMVPAQWMAMVAGMMLAYGLVALVGVWVRQRRKA
jgi:SSS family solute:Na+ symporter